MGADKSQDLIKIIEDYSKQSDLKSKEIDSLVQKMDSKKTKIDEFKKLKLEYESKINKQKNTLDSIKMFLRVLSSNFSKSMKSLKQQNLIIREAYVTNQKSF